MLLLRMGLLLRTMGHDSEKRDDPVKEGCLATMHLDTHYTKPGAIGLSFIPLLGAKLNPGLQVHILSPQF